jgi:tRNA(adenine34) deaminase
MIPPSFKPRKKFMDLAIAEAKRAGDRGDYPIGAVITRLIGKREVVIASAGNRVKTLVRASTRRTRTSNISSGYGRYSILSHPRTNPVPCAGACGWSRIGAVVYGVSQEDIAAYGRKRGTDEYKWRACLISCKFVLEKGSHRVPVTGGFLRKECQKLFSYSAAHR